MSNDARASTSEERSQEPRPTFQTTPAEYREGLQPVPETRWPEVLAESRRMLEQGRLLGLTAEHLDQIEQEMVAPPIRKGVSEWIEEILGARPAPFSWRARVGQVMLRGYDRLQAWRYRRLPPLVLERYNPTQSLDFLVWWWLRLRARGEHRRLFGPEAASVGKFLLQFASMGPGRIVVLHAPGAMWEEARNLMAVAWFGETCAERASLGWWIAPPYNRLLEMVWRPIVDQLLGYGFGELGCQAIDVEGPGRPIIVTRQEWKETEDGREIENYE